MWIPREFTLLFGEDEGETLFLRGYRWSVEIFGGGVMGDDFYKEFLLLEQCGRMEIRMFDNGRV